jgi:hypothetical protein
MFVALVITFGWLALVEKYSQLDIGGPTLKEYFDYLDELELKS